MSPVWLAPTSTQRVVTTGGEKVSALLKEHDGAYYLIAANRDQPEAHVVFQLPLKAGRVIRTLPAGIDRDYPQTEMPLAGGRLEDTFGRYAVHIYEIRPE